MRLRRLDQPFGIHRTRPRWMCAFEARGRLPQHFLSNQLGTVSPRSPRIATRTTPYDETGMVSTRPNRESAEMMVYEEALRRLLAQDERLAAIRRGAVTALTVGAVVGGLLANRVEFAHLPKPQVAGLTVVFIGLAVSAAATVWIHLPKRFVAGPRLKEWQARMEAGTPPSVSVYSFNMVREIEAARRANELTLRRLTTVQAVAWAAVIVHVAGWVLALV